MLMEADGSVEPPNIDRVSSLMLLESFQHRSCSTDSRNSSNFRSGGRSAVQAPRARECKDQCSASDGNGVAITPGGETFVSPQPSQQSHRTLPLPFVICGAIASVTYLGLTMFMLAAIKEGVALVVQGVWGVIVIGWAVVSYRQTSDRVKMAADLSLWVATACSSTLTFFASQAVMAFFAIALVPLLLHGSLFLLATMLSYLVIIVSASVAVSDTPFGFYSDTDGDSSHDRQQCIVVVAESLLLICGASVVHMLMALMRQRLVDAMQCATGTSHVDGRCSGSHAGGEGSSAQVCEGQSNSGANQSPALKHSSTANPLVMDVRRLELANSALTPLCEVEVHSMSCYCSDRDAGSEPLSPISVSPMPTPRGVEALTPNEALSTSRASTMASDCGRVSSVFTPTKCFRRSSSNRVLSLQVRTLTMLSITIRSADLGLADAQLKDAAEDRCLLDELLRAVVQEAVVERGASVIPHFDAGIVVVCWGLTSNHENASVAAVECAVALRERFAAMRITIHAAVTVRRTLCGAFVPSTSVDGLPAVGSGGVGTHVRAVGTALRDNLALLDIAVVTASTCMLDHACALRAAEAFATRPLPVPCSRPAESQATTSASPGQPHILIGPLTASLSAPVPPRLMEWHVLHAAREAALAPFGRYIAAVENLRFARHREASELLQVHLARLPEDGAAAWLLKQLPPV